MKALRLFALAAVMAGGLMLSACSSNGCCGSPGCCGCGGSCQCQPGCCDGCNNGTGCTCNK